MKKTFHVHIVLTIGALASGLLVYLAGKQFGPGLTYDSVNYLYAGQSLYKNGTFTRPMGAEFIEWPPLYPSILSLLAAIPTKLLRAVFYFQMVIAGVTVWLSGKLAKQFIHDWVIFIVAFSAIVFSSPLILINHFVWSEGFFVLLSVVYIHLLIRYTRHPNYLLLGVITLVGALLCLQRHVGVFFVTGSILLVWHYSPRTNVISTLLEGIIHGLLALVPLILWWYRNYLTRGLIMNDYRQALFETPVLTHWLAYNNVFTAWFLPDELNIWVRITLVYGLAIGLLIFYYHPSTRFMYKPYLVAVSGVLFLSYFILTYIASYAVGEAMDDRILAAIYVPGMLLLFVWIDALMYYVRTSVRRWIVFACLVWVMYPVSRCMVNVVQWHHRPTPPPSSQPIDPQFREVLRF